ncbi:MAG: lipoyl(octanoyl) transferase LipB [Prolixibacteraceae bacterium]|jgi:lipoyl(octanoyl) transferase|nr:lipoyl(octanoyl) transferase LipB [Prolixibacteraceae bacterium]MBT6764087.1 lipoyl(octanoyl) transferase LipB [Prolixibacteraceae bacterium]MBT6997548.1 lipoyl(octanoyl) transferase LipB [Prolixibacteraceae bacterium]MBT7394558.1 lipoyl(octanoyl) transferase LipB [Prolixibacteraceae bacterium]
MADFNYINLGIKDYKECWDYQEELLAEVVADKKSTGKPSSKNYFLLVEHPHVYTLGKSGDANNLLAHGEFLKKIEATFYKINRGGDITYHGPGQLVGYPIIDLEYYKLGVRGYIEKMEDAIIKTIAKFGLKGGRKEGATGIWLDAGHKVRARKICAIGVRISRFVTMHGFALNINTDMRYFNYINPCGFATFGVTSIQQELGEKIPMDKIKNLLMEEFNKLY